MAAYIPNVTRDSTWIATQALSRIGASSVDNPPPSEDLALAIDKLDAIVDNLQKRGVVYLGDLNQTPAGIAHELADYLGLILMPDFGNNAPPGSQSIPPVNVIEMHLRRITADLPNYGPQDVMYY